MSLNSMTRPVAALFIDKLPGEQAERKKAVAGKIRVERYVAMCFDIINRDPKLSRLLLE